MAAIAEPETNAIVTAKLAPKLRMARNVQGVRRKLDKYVAHPNVQRNNKVSNMQFVSVSLLSVKFSMIGLTPSMIKIKDISPAKMSSRLYGLGFRVARGIGFSVWRCPH